MAKFIEAQRAELERLVRFLRDYSSVEELMGEIWLAADEVRTRLHTRFDPRTAVDQLEILRRLRQNLAKQDRHARRKLASLDQPIGQNSDRPARLIDMLAADALSDPHAHLVELEGTLDHRVALEREVAGTYSEASAYMILLNRVGGELVALAELLCVRLETIRRRLGRIIDLHRVQGRLFDGVSTIDPDFRARCSMRGTKVRTLRDSPQDTLWRTAAS